MTRNVPHQNAFEAAKSIEKWQTFTLVTSTIFTVGSIVLNAIQKNNNNENFDSIINWVNALSSLFSVAYIILDLLINDRFYMAGKEKRTDLIDHAYDTNFSGDKSTGYFNAQGITKGTYKLAVLGFENSLFTSIIAKKMTYSKWAFAFVVSIIFIISACIGNKELVNNLLQIAATGILMQQAVKLQQFSNRMRDIHADFKTLFNNLSSASNRQSSEGEMVRNIVNYEATHAWGSILMDSELFNKLNPQLSQKWEKMKQDYNIH